MIKTTSVRQIGFLVWDLDKAVEKWKSLTGIEPTISEVESQEITHAMVDGEPCYGYIRQAIFKLDNLEIELIMPINKENSYWRSCIEKNGEGFHHIAFLCDDMEAAQKEMEDNGYKIRQSGCWPDQPKDGQYAYADANQDLCTAIELLELADSSLE